MMDSRRCHILNGNNIIFLSIRWTNFVMSTGRANLCYLVAILILRVGSLIRFSSKHLLLLSANSQQKSTSNHYNLDRVDWFVILYAPIAMAAIAPTAMLIPTLGRRLRATDFGITTCPEVLVRGVRPTPNR